jgi:hypothetical protein
MGSDDFRDNEKSVIIDSDDTLTIRLRTAAGETTVLKESLPVLAGEIVDSTKMNAAALDEFVKEQIAAGQGRRRPLLRPSQGDDDEGLRPHPLRQGHRGLLPRGLRRVR